MFRSASALSAALTLAACAPSYSPNTYNADAVQQASKVDQAVVVGVRQVGVSANGTTGAVVGGAAGGILGSQVPGSSLGTAFGALGGTLIGGIVGTTVAHGADDTTAVEYIVRKTNGDLLSVAQRDKIPLVLGEHVLLIAGKQARIVPDYTVAIPPPPVAMPPALPGLPAQVDAAPAPPSTPAGTAPRPAAVTQAPLPAPKPPAP